MLIPMRVGRIDIDKYQAGQQMGRKIVQVEVVMKNDKYPHAATAHIVYTHYVKFNVLITLQGLPPASAFAGISLVTTLPAAITAFSPIVTPFNMITPPPIKTLSFIWIGFVRMSLSLSPV